MTHPIYTRDLLKNFSRSQLHEICSSLSLKRRRSIEDCIIDILAHQPQLVAQAGLEEHIEQQAEAVAPHQMNQRGYQDAKSATWSTPCGELCAAAGLSMQSSDSCYRVGYDRGLRDISPMPEDSGSQAIAFDKIAEGRWQATVNGVLVKIASVRNGYKTNLTGDAVLIDFGIAIKEALLAVARLQRQEEKPALEVFATNRPNIYAAYSHKPGLESSRYEVNLIAETCTCPHYQHRHGAEGFKDKHIEAVKAAMQLRTMPLPIEEEMLLDKPFDELTAQDWERISQPELELAESLSGGSLRSSLCKTVAA